MGRIEKIGGITLLLLLGTQFWTLHRIEELTMAKSSVLDRHAETSTVQTPLTDQMDHASLAENHQQSDVLITLKKIDARLAALEKASIRNGTATLSPQSHYEPTNNERMAADQRLNTLLPSGPLSREDYARLNANIQSLPTEERFAVATALSRAINEGRVQMAPGAL